MKALMAFLILSASVAAVAGISKVAVRDFGAIPDDGKCDAAAINKSVNSVKAPAEIIFEPGTYNLLDPGSGNYSLIVIKNKTGLILSGAVDASGNPATRFELNVKEMKNDLDTACPLRIYDSKSITVKNIFFDNKPAFATAGVITKVDKAADSVEAEVFEGLPHFSGMSCYSANSWDLKTGELIPVPALTIGANPKKFKHCWEKVPGSNPRLYRIQGMKFSAAVKPGQGMSWHFYVRNHGGGVFTARCEDLRLENLRFNNVKGVGIGSQFCKNIVYKKIIIKPVAPQLASGARDAYHLVCNDGTLLVEDCYVKGVRWDPFNIKSKFCVVSEVVNKRTLKGSVITGVAEPGDMSDSTAVFWVGGSPVVLKLDRIVWEKGFSKDARKRKIKKFTLSLKEDIPASVKAGSQFTPHIWNFDKAIIRNSVFEGNCGRAILYQGENLEISSCLFNNNTYANIALGPIDDQEGGFVRNAKIVNNRFINSTWDNTTPSLPHNGTIKVYQNVPHYFKNQPYNVGITIEGNLFKGINYKKDYSAISISDAQDVIIANNKYIDCRSKIYVDSRSTKDIKIK